MIDLVSLSTKLVQTYGINLTCGEGTDTHGMYIEIQPADIPTVEGFIIRTRVGWRSLESEFIPGNFAGKLIRSMGKADLEKRKLFQCLSESLLETSNSVHMKVNELSLDPTVIKEWPSEWDSLVLILKNTPIVIDETDSHKIEELVFSQGGTLLSLVLSLLPFENIEINDLPSGLPEGSKVRVEVNRYERNHLNRIACISIFGSRCCVCGLDFGEYYGEIGTDFIHVHHLIPISQLGDNYVINPAKDLRPVCPNCHAMIHRKDPPYSIEEIQRIITKNDRKRK